MYEIWAVWAEEHLCNCQFSYKVTSQLSFLQKKGKCNSSLEQEVYSVSCEKLGLKTGEKLSSQVG